MTTAPTPAMRSVPGISLTLHRGDCRDVMAGLLADATTLFDAVVTDPPYEIGIYGQSWDRTGVAFDPAVWRRALDLTAPGGWLAAFGARKTYHRLACAIEDAGWIVEEQLVWAYGQGMGRPGRVKAAHEPVVLARKPGSARPLRIDDCRIPWPDGKSPAIGTPGWGGPKKKLSFVPGGGGTTVERTGPHPAGRWPATLLHDGSAEAIGPLGEKAGYFYAAKADHREKVGAHQTQKPLGLMRWLVRLVAEPGARLLDPFCGTGTTLEAAALEGMHADGIEQAPDHWPLVERRIARALAA